MDNSELENPEIKKGFPWEPTLCVGLISFLAMLCVIHVLREGQQKLAEVAGPNPEGMTYYVGEELSIRAVGKMRGELRRLESPTSFYGLKGVSTMEPVFTVINGGKKERRVFILAKSDERTLLEYEFQLKPGKEFQFHLNPRGDNWKCSFNFLPDNHP